MKNDHANGFTQQVRQTPRCPVWCLTHSVHKCWKSKFMNNNTFDVHDLGGHGLHIQKWRQKLESSMPTLHAIQDRKLKILSYLPWVFSIRLIPVPCLPCHACRSYWIWFCKPLPVHFTYKLPSSPLNNQIIYFLSSLLDTVIFHWFIHVFIHLFIHSSNLQHFGDHASLSNIF